MPTAFLQCIEPKCGRRYALDRREYRCDACGELLDVQYEFEPAEPSALRGLWQQRKLSSETMDRSGVWRFRDLLPFAKADAPIITLGEGNTPLVETPRAGEWAGGLQLAVKQQGNNPTGSFKDLGMTTCITQAAALGIRAVACASTGNTSSSMSAYAARAGMTAVLVVPTGGIAEAKLAQALDLGALVIEVGNNFDEAFRLLRELAQEMGLYLVNSLNPFRLEGQKTVVAELLEQRGWRVPEYIAVPGGNLGNVSAIGKGLAELKQLGLIGRLPRLVVAQAEGANPFYRMLASGSRELVAISEPRTEATAIRIGNPVNWKKALRALDWTQGLCESVTDEEIFEAKRALAADGIGCEPASAAAVAGLHKLRKAGKTSLGADAVAILTGHQLKDPESGIRRWSEARRATQRLRVDPNLKSLRAALQNLLVSS